MVIKGIPTIDKLKQTRLSLLDLVHKIKEDWDNGCGFYDNFGDEADHQDTNTLLCNICEAVHVLDDEIERREAAAKHGEY